jgi:hypothetical protein
MDTNDWAYYAQCSRLKTKRTKKRLQQNDLDKKLIRLAKELRKINSLIRKSEYEELDPPFQRGWKRTFVLRSDLRNLSDAPFFLEILEKINTVQLSHRKDFKIKRRRYGRKIYVDKNQELKSLDTVQCRDEKFTEKQKTYFEMYWEYHPAYKILIAKYAFTESWRFVLEISPNMITKVRVVDVDLLQRQAEIQTYLQRNNLEARMWKLKLGSYAHRNWKKSSKAKYEHLFKTEPIRKMIEELNETKWERLK